MCRMENNKRGEGEVLGGEGRRQQQVQSLIDEGRLSQSERCCLPLVLTVGFEPE